MSPTPQLLRSPACTRALALLGTLATAATLGCARRSEYIGRVSSGEGHGAADGGPDGRGDQRAPGADSGGDVPDGSAAGQLATCWPADPATLVLPRPAFNCGERCLRDEDLPVDPMVFLTAPADPDAARRPLLVYPLPGSVHPLNLPGITLQWKRAAGAGQTVFRIQIAPATGTPYDLFVRHRAPAGPTPAEEADAVFTVPERVWRWIARESAGQSVDLTVSAHDMLAGVSTSAPVSIRFSPGAVEGALHFLSTELTPGINRNVLGARGNHLLVPSTPTAGPGDCVGCHSPSRDGSKLGYAASYAGSLTVVRTSDVARPLIGPMPPPNEANGISPALSPDGQLVLARNGVGDRVTIYRADDGTALDGAEQAFLGGRIDYPEWSPNGQEIVATRAVAPLQPPEEYAANDGEVVIIPFTGNPPRLQKPVPVAPEDGQVQAHPSWSPDGEWIAFVSSPTGMDSHRNPQTTLRLVRRTGGPIYNLGRASGGAGHASTYPRFAPVGQGGCRLLFIAFQSRLPYGLMRRGLADPESPQLWMSAIDVGALGGSALQDPSSPPVWLPFQDVRDKNLLPAWSERAPCASDAVCGPGAACRAERCVAEVP
jgi:hypothetical protein